MRHTKLELIILLILVVALCGCGEKERKGKATTEKTEEHYTVSSPTPSEYKASIEIENEVKTITESVTNEVSKQSDNINETDENDIKEPQEKYITISFVGDCTIGVYKGQGASGTYNEYYDKYGGDYFLENVRDIFEKDDITFINLEGPITDRPTTVEKKFPISCRSEHINVINNSSIEVCGLSNNHTKDCGVDGFNDTTTILSEHNIGYCGEGNVFRQVINGVKIACLAYNGWSANDELLTTISNDISYEKENDTDIVCVMFHWGIERENYSNETQESIAHHTIDCGADIVVGGHPHVIQGIEQYNGKTIVYSLGNFTFGANKNPSDKDTFIFQQTFKVVDNTVSYESYNIIPCSISSETNRNNYQPTPLTDEDKERVLNRLSEYSSKYESSIFNQK